MLSKHADPVADDTCAVSSVTHGAQPLWAGGEAPPVLRCRDATFPHPPFAAFVSRGATLTPRVCEGYSFSIACWDKISVGRIKLEVTAKTIKLKQRHQFFIILPVSRSGTEKIINLLGLECKLEEPNAQVDCLPKATTLR